MIQNIDSHNTGCSNYDAAKMLVKTGKPRLVQLLRRAYAASYNENLHKDDREVETVVARSPTQTVFVF